MPISQFPILSALRTKMQWHQERQRVLAENVANADTPSFRPRDLAPPKLEATMPIATAPRPDTSIRSPAPTANGRRSAVRAIEILRPPARRAVRATLPAIHCRHQPPARVAGSREPTRAPTVTAA